MKRPLKVLGLALLLVLTGRVLVASATSPEYVPVAVVFVLLSIIGLSAVLDLP